jgi:hypothetical protein
VQKSVEQVPEGGFPAGGLDEPEAAAIPFRIARAALALVVVELPVDQIRAAPRQGFLDGLADAGDGKGGAELVLRDAELADVDVPRPEARVGGGVGGDIVQRLPEVRALDRGIVGGIGIKIAAGVRQDVIGDICRRRA